MGSLILPRSGITPSYAAGYARSAAESANPGLWPGLVGAWVPALGVTGGTLRDVISQRDGVFTNMSVSTGWVRNESRAALDFDGDNDYVATSRVVSGGGPLSIMTTLNPASVGVADKPIGVGDGSFDGGSVDITFEGGGVRWRHGGGNITYGAAAAGEWKHIVFTFPASSQTDDVLCYLDGVLTSGGRTGGSDQVVDIKSHTINFGKSAAGNSYYFDGYFGGLILWERELSANEVQTLWRDELAPFRLAPLYFSTSGEAPAVYPQQFYGSRNMTPLLQM